MKIVKLSLCIFSAATLMACSASTAECDPNAPLGLFGKIACASSGSYDQRVSDKEAELAAAQAHNSSLQKANRAAKAKAEQSAEKLKGKKAELNKLNQTVSNYAAQLKEKAKGNDQILQQIKDAESQIQAVNDSSVSDEVKQAELRKLQRKLATYQKALGL
ncbi:hypothetical protein [Ursidibacter arcticus]|uniref:hypothetical protein n=1 Tax=Ursidibacter arcticus TaxID=1524965 RepID=UPI0012F71742|nr:hypothetical protein [Ursidibacter arcticus]KAE9535383.1 hypothetical protein A1D25_05430 [Ursidibacter arcticus]